jgi:sulfur-carrier protein adenylyltransferase/sulfurtransferase
MGMTYIRGDEDVREIIFLAYGMEEGLRGIYAAVGDQTADPDVASLAATLSEIEARHKERLFDLYAAMQPTPPGKETFESDVVAGVMEGGFTTETFLKQNENAMETVPDLLNIAMMLEAQALDLYMRYAGKIQDEVGKGVLHDLAEEEKGHLASLGRLMDRKA